MFYWWLAKNVWKNMLDKPLISSDISELNTKVMTKKSQWSEPCMQKCLFRHFSIPSHNGFFNDVSVKLIDIADDSDCLKMKYFCEKHL